MLVDEATIYVKGGRGGDGAVSFRRESHVPKGGPDGGDGGHGGSVILRATPGVDTLLDMAGRHHWTADSGQPGERKQATGRSADDLIIAVPSGTLVYDADTGDLIDDLDQPNKELLVAKGGHGGFGNEHYKTPTLQTPRFATPGDEGEQRRLRLLLKLIAEVGFIGKPNAGKSTLLSRLSRARPKIADYPFTTLEPQLGIAELPGERRIVLADIPGLIEGASHGAGLGHTFLRHIERTRILVHLIEVEPTDNTDVGDNYRTIRNELKQHSSVLAEKPQIIALNKLDLLQTDADRKTAIELVEHEIGAKVVPISAATGDGCRNLMETCWKMLHKDEE